MSEEIGFDEAISMMVANQGDNQILFRVVAEGLAEALKANTERNYTGRFGKRANELESVAIDLGERVFSLSLERGRLIATISHNSGGIRIGSEKVQVDVWFAGLRKELANQAAYSETARLALERLVMEG